MCDSSAKARVVPPITRVVASAVDNAKDNILINLRIKWRLKMLSNEAIENIREAIETKIGIAFLVETREKFKKTLIGSLIFIHSLAMIILSTRLATYCSALIPVDMLLIYILLMLLKKVKKSYLYLEVNIIDMH